MLTGNLRRWNLSSCIEKGTYFAVILTMNKFKLRSVETTSSQEVAHVGILRSVGIDLGSVDKGKLDVRRRVRATCRPSITIAFPALSKSMEK